MLSREVTTNPKELAVCGFLLLALLLVFGQTVRHEFINLDDDVYVYANPHVSKGLTASGVVYAFSHGYHSAWIPLTWISLMTDWSLYDVHAGGYHLTNVLLHAATAMLLFLLLCRMTNRGLFFVLTLLAYVGYARRRFSLLRYALVAVLFALGLMAKPMLVTLPFVLLLLDYWPLGRMAKTEGDGGGLRGAIFHDGETSSRRPPPSPSTAVLVLEKIPLFALAGGDCLATMLVQGNTTAINEHLRLSWRVGNAAISCVAYLGKFFYPANLAIVYPRPGVNLPVWRVVAADLCNSWRSRRWMCGVASGLVLAASMGAAYRQTSFWRDSETLWNHALQCTPCNGVAHTNVGVMLVDEGRFDEATAHFQQAMKILPNDAFPCYNMGKVAMLCGNAEKAEDYLSRALKLDPRYAPTYNRLGQLFFNRRQFDKAISLFQKSLEINGNDPEVWYDLGRSLKSCGRCDEAREVLRAAADIAPGYAPSHNKLGLIMAGRGQFVEVIENFQKAIDVEPECVEARINLAGVLAQKGCLNESAAQYDAVLKIDPNNREAREAIARIRANRSAPPGLDSSSQRRKAK